jgi:hypothetical protein
MLIWNLILIARHIIVPVLMPSTAYRILSIHDEGMRTFSVDMSKFSTIIDPEIHGLALRMAEIWMSAWSQRDFPGWFHFGAHRFHSGLSESIWRLLRVGMLSFHQYYKYNRSFLIWICFEHEKHIRHGELSVIFIDISRLPAVSKSFTMSKVGCYSSNLM